MYITLFGTILSTSSAPGYERKETLGTIYIKEHEISKENPMVHPIPLAKAFLFTHFSIFTTFGQTLKRLFYHKVILKSINFLIDDRKHRDRGRVIPFSFCLYVLISTTVNTKWSHEHVGHMIRSHHLAKTTMLMLSKRLFKKIQLV